ncbi:MAG: amidase [Bacteroidota bacterium]
MKTICIFKYWGSLFLLSIVPFLSISQSQKKANNNFQILEADIQSIQKGYQKGEFTIQIVVQAYLNRIAQIDKNGPKLNSIIYLNPDALKIARELDIEMRQGKNRGPLHGIPVLLKDNIDTHDMPTTAGSRALMNSYPLTDSYLVKQLKTAGAIIIGKTNLSEWANFRGNLSSSGWSGVGGQTKNPYDLSRSPCGSSSGSGVAIAANLAVLAVGTETNGSIVCPATVNGIVGIKPTVGLISRSGVIPISSTQDTPGPMARTIRDAAIGLGAMVGTDPYDEKTKTSEGKFFKDYTLFLKADGLKGKRIGLFKGAFGVNFKVDELMNKAVEFIKSAGATVIEIEKITTQSQNNNSFEVMLFEYKEGLNNYFKSLGPNAKIKNLGDLIAFNKSDPIEMEHYNQKYLELAQEKGDLKSAAYIEALTQMIKNSRAEGIDKVMNDNQLDAIMAHTGGPSWKIDLVNGGGSGPSSSAFAAHAGYPNITVPMGFVENLPVGVSFFGRAWSEPVLLEIAYGFENGTKHRKVPQFYKPTY